MKGSSMKKSPIRNRIDTTLGELIAAISEVAFEYSADTKSAYHLTQLVLDELLKDSSRGGQIINPPFLWH
jgi:hypothetical protein